MTKVISISDEAYESLKKKKTENDSFSKVILRLSKGSKKKNLLEVINSMKPNEELAKNVEEAYKKLRHAKIRRVEF